MNRLDAITGGSNYNFNDKMMSPSGASSVFDLSHNVIMVPPAKSIGALIPVSVIETVPGDRFDLSVNHLIRVLPQTVPIMSNMKVYFHAFACRNSDLWNSAEVYHSKGYTGNVILKKPVLTADLCGVSANNHIKSDDLLHFLYGLPVSTPYVELQYGNIFGKVSALPYVMYLKIWRDYFCNRYYYGNNLQLFPYSQGDFRLNQSGTAIISDPNHTLGSLLFQPPTANTGYYSFLFRDFADDRFTSAMPQQQRGNPAILESDQWIKGYANHLPNQTGDPNQYVDIGYFGMKYGNITADGAQLQMPLFTGDWQIGNEFDQNNNPRWDIGYGMFNHTRSNNVNNLHNFNSNQPPIKISTNSNILLRQDFKITLNAIRQLAINQTELEKMARTDGSYREFGLTFFGVASKNSVDHCPQYIGGTFEQIMFTEVVQTSQTTSNSVLGQYAGHGMSAKKGSLGSYMADDYGLIMILMSIVPDTFYSQGLDKQFTRLYQAEEFLPERAKLGAQAILKKELRFTGLEVDDDVFAWQDIFDELRYIPSKVRGKVADSMNNSFRNYAIQRNFQSSAPNFNSLFASLRNNINYEWLAAADESPFICDIGLNIRAVRRLPYVAVPSSII